MFILTIRQTNIILLKKNKKKSRTSTSGLLVISEIEDNMEESGDAEEAGEPCPINESRQLM